MQQKTSANEIGINHFTNFLFRVSFINLQIHLKCNICWVLCKAPKNDWGFRNGLSIQFKSKWYNKRLELFSPPIISVFFVEWMDITKGLFPIYGRKWYYLLFWYWKCAIFYLSFIILYNKRLCECNSWLMMIMMKK